MTYIDWTEIKAPDFAAIGRDAVALVPVGATEQHGPHLPMGTDSILAQAIAVAAAKLSQANVYVLPPLTVGKSDEHLDFPGTLTLDAQTLTAVLLQLGRSVARAGFRRIVFLNAHGGNVPVLQIVARALRVELGMFAVTAGWMSMGYPEGLVSAAEARDGIHGGFVETAAMLHLRPDLVDMTKAANFVPRSRSVAETNQVLRLVGMVGAGWMASDLNPEGVAGDAAAADASTGKAIIDHAVARYAIMLDEVAAMSIAHLGAIP